MSSPRVLLVAADHLYWVSEANPIMVPVKPGLLALYSYLKNNGVDAVSVLDLDREDRRPPRSPGELSAYEAWSAELLAAYDYDVLAISCLATQCYQGALLLARLSRQLRPRAVIVVGGWHSLSEPQDFVEHAGLFDFVVSGTGEKPLLAIARGELRPSAQGCEVVEASPLSRAEHARFEYRYREYVAEAPARYRPAFQAASTSMLPISRGCPSACDFCGNSLSQWKLWTPLDVDLGLSLVEDARAAHPRFDTCYFADAMFGADPHWRREFLEQYARAYPGLPNVVVTRVDVLQPRDVELFATARVFVLLGVESLSRDMLRIMHKTNRPERYIEATGQVIGWLRAAQVPHELFMIRDHPGETEETLGETLANLERVVGPWTTLVGFAYIHFPQFARRYADYRQRFGTELLGPVRWWKEPTFIDGATLTRRYVPSKKDSEMFERGQERMQRAVGRADSLYRAYARTKPHGEVVREGG